ncbi:MAG: HD domain-containing protein [Deltaproteobacteria bacterium]|nr:HD domain-containing protein [Deltaproteobacteria bacterium]
MIIPSRDICFSLMKQMAMPGHIVDHSLQVCRVAAFLTEQLSLSGVPLDSRIVEAAALLHDITKARSFTTGEQHDRTARLLLEEQGYVEVGRVAGQHVILETYLFHGAPGEADVVNYADKRVLHDKVVSLEERMDYIRERYGTAEDRRAWIDRLWRKTLLLEDALFERLDFHPGDLAEFIEAARLDDDRRSARRNGLHS